MTKSRPAALKVRGRRKSYIREALIRVREAGSEEERAARVEELMKAVRRIAATVARGMLRDEESADDVAQDVSVAFFIAMDRICVDGSPWRFAHITAVRRSLDVIKRRRRTEAACQTLTARTREEDRVARMHHDDEARARDLIDTLPLATRAIMNRTLDGESIDEIAEAVGLSPTTVGRRLAEAKKSLRALVRGSR